MSENLKSLTDHQLLDILEDVQAERERRAIARLHEITPEAIAELYTDDDVREYGMPVAAIYPHRSAAHDELSADVIVVGTHKNVLAHFRLLDFQGVQQSLDVLCGIGRDRASRGSSRLAPVRVELPPRTV